MANGKSARTAGFAAPNWLLLLAYAAAIFVSASLLFAVQPLFTKLVLPRLGGSPSVWSVAMVFFQAMLLAGYAYAHLLTRYFSLRHAVAIHLVVMLAATIALPLSIAAGWGRPPAQGEAFYLIGLFTISVGLPFFALAANSPLLQAWFARTTHPAAKDPYFLYAAGNVGSFLALLSYPLLVEPLTLLRDQRQFWSFGFYVLIVLIAVCGALVWVAKQSSQMRSETKAGKAPGVQDALTWTALAAVPSAFLIAITSYISTDVGSTPLLWVIPLALYLATFVIVFQSRPVIPHSFALAAQPVAVALLVGIYMNGATDAIFTVIAANLAAFFVTTLVCHGELARRRPPARYLTTFYLWMSFGGMIGGIFAGLIAPYIFNWIAEYPLLIVAGLLCRPGLFDANTVRNRLAWFIGWTILAIAVTSYMRSGEPSDAVLMAAVSSVLLVSVILLRDPLKFAAVAGLILLIGFINQVQFYPGESVRNFFGVHKVYMTRSGVYRILLHGTTVHGAEAVNDQTVWLPGTRPVPLTYYHAESGLARTISASRSKIKGPLRVAVIGLGTGTLACYAQKGDTWTFYEIDQSIVDIATDRRYFTFKTVCAPEAKIILGDARLTLEDAANKAYDLIIVDAFSSDAIPIHLLTREAMATYLAKLAPRGMIVMHISNRHLELQSIVAGIADANGLKTCANVRQDEQEDSARYIYASTVTASVRAPEDFGVLQETAEGWDLVDPDPKQWVWTDDYSNVVGAMIRHMRE